MVSSRRKEAIRRPCLSDGVRGFRGSSVVPQERCCETDLPPFNSTPSRERIRRGANQGRKVTLVSRGCGAANSGDHGTGCPMGRAAFRARSRFARKSSRCGASSTAASKQPTASRGRPASAWMTPSILWASAGVRSRSRTACTCSAATDDSPRESRGSAARRRTGAVSGCSPATPHKRWPRHSVRAAPCRDCSRP